jgi:(E)-4-hydroxy-3-methylbut-2-enyl-diphosphate synthase
MAYCVSRFSTVRRRTVAVQVGAVGVGADHPIRVQSMTTSDTQDVAATVGQCIALAEVGCEIVRVTAPNVAAARCLRAIRERFTAAGFGAVPLVADIHFLPQAAMEAALHVEKVRVNPGNYADKKRFAVREYSDAEYEQELARLDAAFSPLVLRCRELGRAMRIGTNHGSLSDRIMNRYGDSPLGMVESALEFLRIAERHDYRQIVLSMKASNPKVMIEAYRLLVERMAAADMHYPLHLGVTEAGDGEDGRIKGAIGIGSLLLDGLGDTIRVSLTEDSVYEIPVARALAEKAMSGWSAPEPHPPAPDGLDPFHYARRPTVLLPLGPGCAAGAGQPPRVIVRASPDDLGRADSPLRRPRRADTPAEGVLLAVASAAAARAAFAAAAAAAGAAACVVLELAPALTPDELAAAAGAAGPPAAGILLLRRFGPDDGAALAAWADWTRARAYSLACDVTPAALAALAPGLRRLGPAGLVVTWGGEMAEAGAHAVGVYRRLAETLRQADLPLPLWIRATPAAALQPDPSFLSRLLEASILAGSLLGDGLGDLLSCESEADPDRALRLAYNVLQGAGARSTKTDFVACPSCGRTLFDLQTTTQRIRARTGHLKGVKIAIMGCVVNGPGEMADADFGYVGGAPAKINLYVGRQCVQYNVPQDEADERLIALIREHGKWVEPSPIPT